MRRIGLTATYLFGLLLATLQVSAQTDRFVDKVVLTNGSIIWGLGELEGQQMKIFLDSQDSITVPVEYVKTLKTGKLNPDLYMERVLGPYCQVSVGVLLGKSYQYTDNEASFSASFTSGYKFKRSLGIGIGVGLNYYIQQRHIPVYLDLQGDIVPGRITPFYQLNAGWSWGSDRTSAAEIDKVKGGFYLKPSVGLKWHFARHSWFLLFSYVHQQATTYYQPIDNWNGSSVTNVEGRQLQRFGISTGLSF